MSKRIIDLPDEVVKAIQNGLNYRYDIVTAIAQSKPYDDSGDCISRSALLNQIDTTDWSDVRLLVEDAPAVEAYTETDLIDANKVGYKTARSVYERPQGECRTCKHRDPEDKKCDCGGQERQGCCFPVSDDYFCKFYEKGGAEE